MFTSNISTLLIAFYLLFIGTNVPRKHYYSSGSTQYFHDIYEIKDMPFCKTDLSDSLIVINFKSKRIAYKPMPENRIFKLEAGYYVTNRSDSLGVLTIQRSSWPEFHNYHVLDVFIWLPREKKVLYKLGVIDLLLGSELYLDSRFVLEAKNLKYQKPNKIKLNRLNRDIFIK